MTCMRVSKIGGLVLGGWLYKGSHYYGSILSAPEFWTVPHGCERRQRDGERQGPPTVADWMSTSHAPTIGASRMTNIMVPSS